MSTEYINLILFAFHSALIVTKLYILYKLFGYFNIKSSQSKNNFLMAATSLQLFIFIFTFIIVLSEINYISSFYAEVDLYYYEYLTISDNIFFSLIVSKLLQREKDGKAKISNE